MHSLITSTTILLFLAWAKDHVEPAITDLQPFKLQLTQE